MGRAITFSCPRPAPFFTPIFVAIDKGFLAEEGLDGSMLYIDAMARLQNKEVDFAFGSPLYSSFLESSNCKLIAGLSTRESSHILMIRPGIEISEMENVLLPGDPKSGQSSVRFRMELSNILSLKGIDFTQTGIETQVVPGSHKEQWEMLKEGIGDAATLGAPFWIFASKAGYTYAGHEADYSVGATGSALYARPETIANDSKLTEAVVRAFVKAVNYSIENPEGTLETIMKYCADWGVDGPDIAKAAYDDVLPYWKTEIDIEAIRKLFKDMSGRVGRPAPDPESFLELRFLEEALRS